MPFPSNLPRFFYRLPDDAREARAMIDTVSSSVLVGQVNLVAVGTVGGADAPEGQPVRAVWDITWKGMARSAPWERKSDPAAVLAAIADTLAEAGIVAAESGVVIGVNVPLSAIAAHFVGKGSVEGVRILPPETL